MFLARLQNPEFWDLGILTFRSPQTPSKRSLVEVDRKSAKHCLLGLVSAMVLARLQIPEFWDPGILTLRSPQTPSKVGAEVLRFP